MCKLMLVIVSIVCCNQGLMSKALKQEAKKPDTISTKNVLLSESKVLSIKDWFAFGSGCKGRKDKTSDIKLIITNNIKKNSSYRFAFDMKSYYLDGKKPINAKRATFARECSLRLAVHPSHNWRIADISMQTDLKIVKDVGVKAEINARLLTASGHLSNWNQVWKEKQKLDSHFVHLHLKPSSLGRNHLSKISCGQAKLLGADLSFLNHRRSFKPQVSMRHDQSNKVVIDVTLEPCKV